MDYHELQTNLNSVNLKIATAKQARRQNYGDVQLLCITKMVTIDTIRLALDAGQNNFGENYVDEAITKIAALKSLSLRPCWHFVGSIQSNKAEVISKSFDWVQSVDRVKIIRLLGKHRPSGQEKLQICIQVNVGGEVSKGGTQLESVPELVDEVMAQPRLSLRGLMSIPPPSDDITIQRTYHRQLRQAFEKLQDRLPSVDTLSMGMSADLEAAIAEGSTMVRVGSALFGARPKKEILL